MTMKFDPNNPIIKLCMKAMSLEESEKIDETITVLHKAWDQASDDYEKFLVAYHLGIRQKSNMDKLKWMKTSLSSALRINDENVISAYPILYSNIAKYYDSMDHSDEALKNYDLAKSYRGQPTDSGPFYHGTKADLQVGDLLTAGGKSNYKDDLKMNHIYFTANIYGAGLAAALAKGTGRERVYVIEPTGTFENDPNVTDKKFPGNLTRSYRSEEPLKVLSEITEWAKLTDSERKEWDQKLSKNDGEIIN